MYFCQQQPPKVHGCQKAGKKHVGCLAWAAGSPHRQALRPLPAPPSGNPQPYSPPARGTQTLSQLPELKSPILTAVLMVRSEPKLQNSPSERSDPPRAQHPPSFLPLKCQHLSNPLLKMDHIKVTGGKGYFSSVSVTGSIAYNQIMINRVVSNHITSAQLTAGPEW